MKIIYILALSLVLVVGTAASAFATHEGGVTGRDYGWHIVEHAQMQHFGAEMNPGMHRGFAGFEEHHDHGDM